ncbi:MAG: hypothetical protein JWN04_5754 [Myxococcaceae bacterium]|nr:hypothetical protein [Myxococcaceae bacterium]
MLNRAEPERRFIVDHMSSHGPTATHIRGTMLVSSLENLRELGLYERYSALLSTEHREAITYCIAASWVPMGIALAHYQTVEEMGLDDSQRTRLAELMADRVAATFLSAVLRATRSAGIASFVPALKHNNRLYDRMYQGGGVRVIQTGPKDIVWETLGVPLVQCRYWRTAFASYLGAIVRMFTKTAFVKQVHPLEPHPFTIAFAVSWV